MKCTKCNQEILEVEVPCGWCNETGMKKKFFGGWKVCRDCNGTGIFSRHLGIMEHYEAEHPDLVILLDKIASRNAYAGHYM